MGDPAPSGGDFGAIVAELREVKKRLREVESASGTQRALTAQRTPVQDFRTTSVSGIGLAAGWNTYATVTLEVPTGKKLLQVLGIGTAAVLDQTSGGLTTSYGRVVINGVDSREFPAAKDAGATVVNNVITATSSAVVDVSALTTVEIAFELRPLNAAAYPPHAQNFAQLAVIGSFTIA